MHRRALEGREKVLGVEHPDTLTSVYCLAYLLHTPNDGTTMHLFFISELQQGSLRCWARTILQHRTARSIIRPWLMKWKLRAKTSDTLGQSLIFDFVHGLIRHQYH